MGAKEISEGGLLPLWAEPVGHIRYRRAPSAAKHRVLQSKGSVARRYVSENA
jgi:hypothetical protein